MLLKYKLRTALILVALAALAQLAFAKKFALTPSSSVPSASGEINTKTDRNGNTDVDLTVSSLAKAGSLTPPATSYVVWFEQQGSAPENEGELRVDDKLKGEFKTTTPWKNFEVFITGESDPMVKSPSGNVVLRSRVAM